MGYGMLTGMGMKPEQIQHSMWGQHLGPQDTAKMQQDIQGGAGDGQTPTQPASYQRPPVPAVPNIQPMPYSYWAGQGLAPQQPQQQFQHGPVPGYGGGGGTFK